MSESTIHQLLMIALVFTLIVFGALLFLEPVYAVLWLLLCLLVCLIAAVRKPHVFEGEKKRISELLSRIKGTGVSETVYDVSFKPDHMLVDLSVRNEKNLLIDKEAFVIGRNKACDCCLQSERQVSSMHCRIVYRKYSHMYFIEDLRSSNGTYLGTRRLEPYVQEKLLDDAQITIGQHKFLFVKRI